MSCHVMPCHIRYVRRVMSRRVTTTTHIWLLFTLHIRLFSNRNILSLTWGTSDLAAPSMCAEPSLTQSHWTARHCPEVLSKAAETPAQRTARPGGGQAARLAARRAGGGGLSLREEPQGAGSTCRARATGAQRQAEGGTARQ